MCWSEQILEAGTPETTVVWPLISDKQDMLGTAGEERMNPRRTFSYGHTNAERPSKNGHLFGSVQTLRNCLENLPKAMTNKFWFLIIVGGNLNGVYFMFSPFPHHTVCSNCTYTISPHRVLSSFFSMDWMRHYGGCLWVWWRKNGYIVKSEWRWWN